MSYSPPRTKLIVPELPKTHVPRPRLVRHLDDSCAEFAITLVAGFAGSGKTVMLADFARSRPAGTVAWLSCDVTDADPAQFWSALVGALRVFDPSIGGDALDLIDADGELGHDAIASVVNDLFDLEGVRVLVIDDLHLVARVTLAQLGALLERLPSHLRVVLSARSDPALPLHRWRAGGRLGEVRAAELRMAADEVAQFLNSVGVDVSAEDAALLADRTEGWTAGVQLAALSMRQEREPVDFIRTFAGTDRNVADFLIGEILQRQPDDVVDFLLATSVLDELRAPVCDVLTGRTDSTALLARLEHENLFVVALDNEQTFYRYHHLFAELLRRLLDGRYPGRALALHRLASDWYAEHDDPRRAVRHAILAEDPALVTALLRERIFTAFYTGTSEMVREWISELSRARHMPPELTLEYALALVTVGALDDARVWLDRAAASLPETTSARSRARLAIAYGLVRGLEGDVRAAVAAADQARALVEPGVDNFVDGTLLHVRLRTSIYNDDLAAARELYARSRPGPGESEQLDLVVVEGIFSQAELESGELESAEMHARGAQSAMERLGAVGHFGESAPLRTLGALAYERDELDEAERYFERCIALVQIGRPIFLLLTRIELARTWNGRGDPVAALAELERARAAVAPDITSVLTERVDAYRARILAEYGDVENGRLLVASLSPGRRRAVAEVRCDLAEGDAASARAVLEQFVASSPTPRAALEDALLDARTALVDGDDALEQKLEHVLALGRSGGFIRTLADEGPELAAVLADALRRQSVDAYSDRLAPVLERAIAATPAQSVLLYAGVELSERELTVLKYLATRLSTREIAAELFVSMNTFRTHTKSIYRKLGVESRATAVDAAHTAGIF